MTDKNQRVILNRVPQGAIVAEDFALVDAPMPVPGPGEMLIRTLALSLDPYMALAIRGQHLTPQVMPGDLMPGETVGAVVSSNHPDYAPGDMVLTRSGWQSHFVAGPESGATGMDGALATGARKLPSDRRAPPSFDLGVLGMPGLTAYAGTVHLADPRPGQTFVVSAASGAVGSIAGQIARNMGARAVGIAGSDEKCAYLVEQLGFHAAVNYRNPDWPTALAAACPDRIDAYFDNAGGKTLEIVMGQLAHGARIVLCGMMEQLNSSTPLPNPSLVPIIFHRAQMKGLVVYDFFDQRFLWRRIAGDWLAEGKLVYKEERTMGLAGAAAAFARVLTGQKFGKSVVIIADS